MKKEKRTDEHDALKKLQICVFTTYEPSLELTKPVRTNPGLDPVTVRSVRLDLSGIWPGRMNCRTEVHEVLHHKIVLSTD